MTVTSTRSAPLSTSVHALRNPDITSADANTVLRDALVRLVPLQAGSLAGQAFSARLAPAHHAGLPSTPGLRAVTVPLAELGSYLDVIDVLDLVEELLMPPYRAQPWTLEEVQALTSLDVASRIEIRPSYLDSRRLHLTAAARDHLLSSRWPWPSFAAISKLSDSSFTSLLLAVPADLRFPSHDTCVAQAITSLDRLCLALPQGPRALTHPKGPPTLIDADVRWHTSIAALVKSHDDLWRILPHLTPVLRRSLLLRIEAFEALPAPSGALVDHLIADCVPYAPLENLLTLSPSNQPQWYLARLLLRVPGLAFAVLAPSRAPRRLALQHLVYHLSRNAGVSFDTLSHFLHPTSTAADAIRALRILQTQP